MQNNEAFAEFSETYRSSTITGLDLDPPKTRFNVNFKVGLKEKKPEIH